MSHKSNDVEARSNSGEVLKEFPTLRTSVHKWRRFQAVAPHADVQYVIGGPIAKPPYSDPDGEDKTNPRVPTSRPTLEPASRSPGGDRSRSSRDLGVRAANCAGA